MVWRARVSSRRGFLANAARFGGAALAARLSPELLSGAFAGESLVMLMSQPQVGAAQIMVKRFKEVSGVSVEIVPVPLDQIQQQLTLDMESGAKRFDAFDFWYISKGALAKQGIALDLTDLIEKDRATIQPSDFIQSIYDAYSLVNGRRYSLPFDGDTHVLFYNTEIFERNKVSPPKTWNEVITAAQKITDAEKANGIYGIALMGVKVPIINISVYANRLVNFGGSFLTKDGKPALNSPEALAAAENLVATIPAALPTPAETGFTEALNAFIGGRAAMTEGWTDLGVYAEDTSKSKISGKWDVVSLPVGGSTKLARSPLNAGWALGVAAYSSKQKLAWELIKFGTTSQIDEVYLTTTGSGIDPSRVSNLTSEAYKKFTPKVQRAASQSLNGAVAWPTSPEAPRMLEALSSQIASIMAGEKKPADGLAEAQRAWERLIR